MSVITPFLHRERLGRECECHRQFDRIESLVADITKNIELGVVQYGVGQTNHLTVGLIGVEDARAHPTDVFRKTHHEFLADGVDGRVRYLCELLTEIVEECLRFVGEHSQRGIVTHRGGRLLTVDGHRNDGAIHILFAVAEHHFLL